MRRASWILTGLFLFACGTRDRSFGTPRPPGASSDAGTMPVNDYGPTDPRCDPICVVEEPAVEGAFEICSQASAALCKATCTAQVEDLSSVCATCLLEEAAFPAAGDSAIGTFCETDGTGQCAGGSLCEMRHQQMRCQYCEGDQTAQEECLRQLYPRTEVACDVGLRDVAECSSVCEGDLAVPYQRTVDPRCEQLCRDEPPSLDGAYEVCSAASVAACRTQCQQRITGVASLCASCLLEDSSFPGPEARPSPGSFCEPSDLCPEGGSRCTLEGFGDAACEYCEGDQEAWEACVRQIFPRTEVECTPDFRPVTECEQLCAG